jgi:hypothetical protein
MAKNLWENTFEKYFEKKDKREVVEFLHMVGISLSISNYGDEISQLFECLGIDSFIKMLHVVSGRTVQFPPIQIFREQIILCLIFIMRERNMSWEEIQQKLHFPYKYGIKISFLKKKIKKEMYKALVGKEKTE